MLPSSDLFTVDSLPLEKNQLPVLPPEASIDIDMIFNVTASTNAIEDIEQNLWILWIFMYAHLNFKTQKLIHFATDF